MGFLISIMMYMFYIYKFGIRKVIDRILETEFFNIILNKIVRKSIIVLKISWLHLHQSYE